jgi:CheY-specific phosphatase CheX
MGESLMNDYMLMEVITNETTMQTMDLLSDEIIWQLVLMVFGVGLVTGGMIFVLSLGISAALNIFKSI